MAEVTRDVLHLYGGAITSGIPGTEWGEPLDAGTTEAGCWQCSSWMVVAVKVLGWMLISGEFEVLVTLWVSHVPGQNDALAKVPQYDIFCCVLFAVPQSHTKRIYLVLCCQLSVSSQIVCAVL